MFDPKEKVMMEPNEAMSKFFGRRPRLANKVCISPTQDSPSVAKTFLEKKEFSSKKIEDKISLRNTENRMSSKSIENKDNLINRQSSIWSSSFLREITGEGGQDTGLAKQEKINEYCHQDIDDKLSESTDEDEDNPNDDDDKGSNPKKKTRAPLELMAEFLRAEMCRDYQLAKKLCQMILIYEPENPVAKEFFSLIEEILRKEKAHNVEEEDDNDSDEDGSSDSEEESSEDGSDDSSDDCDDAS
uniref:glutamate-rich protein 2 n=1 Tax=Jaculus jaculus TaxID=51337 RepID=UPI001E1B1010|nr:glutamate-rich protein 2 [Jaculus jaculus]